MINSFLAHLAVSIGLFYSVSKLFEKLDLYVNNITKKNVADWVLQKTAANNKISHTSDLVLTSLFGKKIISIRSLLASALVSTIFFLLIYLVVCILDPRYFQLIIYFDDLAMIFIIISFLNIFPDFVSFVETRLLLKLFNKYNFSLPCLTLFIGMDILATTIIFFTIPLLLLIFIERPIDGGSVYYLQQAKAFFLEMGSVNLISDREFHKGLYVAFFTTFSTSIWLWLYYLSSWLVKTQKILQKYLPYSSIEEKPFTIIGAIAGLATSFIYIFSFFLFQIII